MQQPKILYVEDYELVLSTVKEVLQVEGWQVDVCREGTAALKQIESNAHFDLILLDCNIPGVNGLELLQRARALTHRHHTPIVMFTSRACEVNARAAGANGFLRKPHDIEELIAMVKSLLANGAAKHH